MTESTISLLWYIVSITTALFAVIYAYYKWTYQYWKRKGVPYLEPKIPYGNQTTPFPRNLTEIMDDIYKKAKAKGWKYCGLYIPLYPALLVLDLDIIKHMITIDYQYFNGRGDYTNEKVDPIGCHLVALSGSKWKNLRSRVSGTFTSGKLKAMFQTLVDCGLVLEKYVEEKVRENELLDIKDVLARFSTDVIGSCAFGIDINSFKDPDSKFKKYGNRIFYVTKLEAIRNTITTNFPNFGRAIGLRQVSKETSDFFTKVLGDTISYRDKNQFVRKDFLQLLLDLRTGKNGQLDGNIASGDGTTLTKEEIIAQCYIFFLAGFETGTTTMTFALFELALHSDIQDRVRSEINSVLAKHNGQVTYDSVRDMNYLEQVINETLRMHTPARLLRRICTEDYKIPGEDVVIEKGTRIYFNVKSIHLDEEYWENPTKFDPDRFSEENKKNIKSYSFLPFGEGPRLCIGERFGLMEVKVGLSCILKKFKVTLNKKTKLPLKLSAANFVSAAEGGIWLNLEKIA